MSPHDPVIVETSSTVVESPAPAPVVMPAGPVVAARTSEPRRAVVRPKAFPAPPPTTTSTADRIARSERQLGPPKSAYWRNQQIDRDQRSQIIEALRKSEAAPATDRPAPPQNLTLNLGKHEISLFEELIKLLRQAEQRPPAAPTTSTTSAAPPPAGTPAAPPAPAPAHADSGFDLPEDLTDLQYQLLAVCHRAANVLIPEFLPKTDDAASNMARQIHQHLVEFGRKELPRVLHALDKLLAAEGNFTEAHEAVRELFDAEFFAHEGARDAALLDQELRRRAALAVAVLQVIASAHEHA